MRRDHETSDTGKSYRHRPAEHSSVVLLAASSAQQQSKTVPLQNYATLRDIQHYLFAPAIVIRDVRTIGRYRNHLAVSQPGDINDARYHSDNYMFQQARHSAKFKPSDECIRFNVVRTNTGNAEEPTIRDDVSETSDTFYQMCSTRTFSALLLHGPIFSTSKLASKLLYFSCFLNAVIEAVLIVTNPSIAINELINARFECLAVELQNNTNVRTLIACIEKQLRLKRYAEDVISCFRFMVLFVVALCSFLMTLCAVIMVMNTLVTVKMMLLLLNAYFLMYLYMYAWPADNMKDMVEHSLSLSRSAYDLTWYKQALGMQKNLLYVMTYQKPVTLSIKCIITELSLHYYCTRIVGEMYICMKEMQQHEREIFDTYLARCNVIYASYIIGAYVMASIYLLGPTMFPMINIINAEYPFDTNRTSISVMIRAHQILTGYQYCSHLCLCVFGGLLFWFTAARFECLAVELQNNTNVHQSPLIAKCNFVQQHTFPKYWQKFARQWTERYDLHSPHVQLVFSSRYAEDVITCFRFMVLFIVALCSFLMTLCAVIMVMNTSVTVKTMLLLLNAYFLMYLYMYAWPADNMKDMVGQSLSLPRSTYDLMWYEQTLGMQKNLLYVMMYQKPVTLSIKCVIKELSLHYYCTVRLPKIERFATIRTILQ
ncbi:hypothetical protein WN51_09467 [Melipona quadrifasciata]|uniref:Uncharacterized protein n=1 Tax=Melipona quadrifasciata TaxID=166423 RepID=A0A0N0U6Y3_9HYME|nr:hypothetical protein WN51_09467 [Melipona quadrifasciata]